MTTWIVRALQTMTTEAFITDGSDTRGDGAVDLSGAVPGIVDEVVGRSSQLSQTFLWSA